MPENVESAVALCLEVMPDMSEQAIRAFLSCLAAMGEEVGADENYMPALMMYACASLWAGTPDEFADMARDVLNDVRDAGVDEAT